MKGSYNDLRDSEYLKEIIGIHKGHMNLSNVNEGIKASLNEKEDKSIIEDVIDNLDDVHSQSDTSS